MTNRRPAVEICIGRGVCASAAPKQSASAREATVSQAAVPGSDTWRCNRLQTRRFCVILSALQTIA